LPGKLADVVKTASRYIQTASSSASRLADLGAEAHLGRPEGGLVLEGVDVARCHHQDPEDHSGQGAQDVLLDFGWPLSWPQSASPAELQPFVFNKAAEVTSPMPWYSLGRASLKNSPSSRTLIGRGCCDSSSSN
jgi:hypothetical protein